MTELLLLGTADRQREIDTLVALLASIAKPQSATYVSAPLTSGRWSAEWRQNHGACLDTGSAEYAAAFEREVIDRNRRNAATVVAEQRVRCHGPVIDPTLFPTQPDWTQDDYRRLWAKIIERYAVRVVFVDGWAYSSGCAYEFLVARAHGIETVDQREQPLPVDVGMETIRRAIGELDGVDDVAFLRRVLAALGRVAYSRI